MLARVSTLESFRYWRDDEEAELADLEVLLFEDSPSEAMLAGTAFHKALEAAQPGEYEQLQAEGYTFLMPDDAEIALPSVRELRAFGQYGPLRVTGQVDLLHGRRIEDHKTTGRFDPERYLDGYQWRFYLDLLDADTFRWNVFEIDELKPRVYQVRAPQILEQRRYPGMHADCAKLAADFYAVVSQHFPDFTARIAA